LVVGWVFCPSGGGPRPDAADRGELRLHVHGVSGPSGATLLGRFCHGDAALRAHVIAHLREEEALRPDVIFAEIVHLPGGRLGNILGRPMLREYEIVYLASGGADEAHQIRIDDLLVSVRGTRVMLRSRRLDREIVPRMTTAHNYSGAALGIYRFLCALQTQDGASLGFSWGLLEHAPFLPRVRSGRAVLCPATWTLAKTDLAPLARGSLAARYAAARALRERLRIPRWAGLRDGDNVLPIDFEQPLYLDAIASMLKSRDTVQLVEITISASEACACGPEGSFAHEIVVPFVRTSSRGASTVRAADARFSARTFAPGSEWLYAKIYTGTAAAEAVLRDAIAPLRAQWAPQTWFFIRYSDPHSHLRVRFRGDPARLAGEILPALHEALAPMLADGRVWRLQLDTYAREVERYGGPVGVELAEELFAADSDAALAIALALRDDHGNQRRCDLALYGAHRLLCDLGLDLAARLALVRTAREAFAREHAVTRDFERHLGLKFRQRRAVIEELLGRGVDDNTGAAFEMRGVRVQQISVKLRSEIAAGAIMLPVDDLAASFVHMHINRMLRADHRAQELVIYDMLERVYDAKFARARRGGAGD
jgi:thiopeptide-type bacteriocin biosynthesis protein